MAASPNWQSIDGFDSDIAFSLPCAVEDVEFRGAGNTADPGERSASCVRDGVKFSVEVFQFPADTKEAVFDDLATQMLATDDQGLEPIQLEMNGHRHIADRVEVEGFVAQRATVELNTKKVALIMAGAASDDPVLLASQRNMVDQFFKSIQVNS